MSDNMDMPLTDAWDDQGWEETSLSDAARIARIVAGQRTQYQMPQDAKTVLGAGEETVLEEAQRLIYGDRAASYGRVTDQFGRLARLWSEVLDTEVTPHQVGLCMIQLKISREMAAHARDNIVDIAGYAGCMDKLERGL